MLAERHAENGVLERRGGVLVLALPRGGHYEIEAWPSADRYLDQPVHLIGRLIEGSILVAESIAPLRPD